MLLVFLRHMMTEREEMNILQSSVLPPTMAAKHLSKTYGTYLQSGEFVTVKTSVYMHTAQMINQHKPPYSFGLQFIPIKLIPIRIFQLWRLQDICLFWLAVYSDHVCPFKYAFCALGGTLKDQNTIIGSRCLLLYGGLK